MSEMYDQEKETRREAEYEDFYTKLRLKVDSYLAGHDTTGLGKYLTYVPDFFYMLVKLSTDADVPKNNKGQIVAALAYFLLPIDVIPDFIPGLGWADDLYIALIVTDSLLNSVELEVVKKYWQGEDDIVEFIKGALDMISDKIGPKAIARIVEKFKDSQAD